MQKSMDITGKTPEIINTDKVLLPNRILDRGLNESECKTICTTPIIPIREKLFFRIIYEGMLRPFEVLNLKIEDWDRNQGTVTAVIVKQKTSPVKDNLHKKIYLKSQPRTALLSDNSQKMLREIVGNRKKGFIFINRSGSNLDLSWFNKQINRYASLLGIQKVVGYYSDGRTLKLVTCMALREAGERHHDNAGGSRKISAVMAGHTMDVKQKHYEKIGDDFEQVHNSIQEHHPAFKQNW